jgi:hypothetical protein
MSGMLNGFITTRQESTDTGLIAATITKNNSQPLRAEFSYPIDDIVAIERAMCVPLVCWNGVGTVDRRGDTVRVLAIG